MPRQPVVKVLVGNEKVVPDHEIRRGNVRFSMSNLLVTGNAFVPKYRTWDRTKQPMRSLSTINIMPAYKSNGDLLDCDLEVQTSGEEQAKEDLERMEVDKRVSEMAKLKLQEAEKKEEFQKLVDDVVSQALERKKKARQEAEEQAKAAEKEKKENEKHAKNKEKEKPSDNVRVKHHRGKNYDTTEISAKIYHKIDYDTDSDDEANVQVRKTDQKKKADNAKSDKKNAEISKSDNKAKKKKAVADDTEEEGVTSADEAPTDGEKAGNSKNKDQGKKGKAPAPATTGGNEWTPSEDATITAMKEGGESWASIANAISRSKSEVQKRYKELSSKGDTAKEATVNSNNQAKTAKGGTAGNKSGSKSPTNDRVVKLLETLVEGVQARDQSPRNNRSTANLHQAPEVVSGFPPPVNYPHNYYQGHNFQYGADNYPGGPMPYARAQMNQHYPFMDPYYGPSQFYPSQRHDEYRGPHTEVHINDQPTHDGRHLHLYQYKDSHGGQSFGNGPTVSEKTVDGVRMVRIQCNTGHEIRINGNIVPEPPNGWQDNRNHNAGSSNRGQNALQTRLNPGDLLWINGKRIIEPLSGWGNGSIRGSGSNAGGNHGRGNWGGGSHKGPGSHNGGNNGGVRSPGKVSWGNGNDNNNNQGWGGSNKNNNGGQSPNINNNWGNDKNKGGQPANDGSWGGGTKNNNNNGGWDGNNNDNAPAANNTEWETGNNNNGGWDGANPGGSNRGGRSPAGKPGSVARNPTIDGVELFKPPSIHPFNIDDPLRGNSIGGGSQRRQGSQRSKPPSVAGANPAVPAWQQNIFEDEQPVGNNAHKTPAMQSWEMPVTVDRRLDPTGKFGKSGSNNGGNGHWDGAASNSKDNSQKNLDNPPVEEWNAAPAAGDAAW